MMTPAQSKVDNAQSSSAADGAEPVRLWQRARAGGGKSPRSHMEHFVYVYINSKSQELRRHFPEVTSGQPLRCCVDKNSEPAL